MANNTITLDRGNTLITNFTAVDTSGNPISLEGAVLYFTVKAPPGWDNSTNDSTALWQKTSSGNTGNTCTFTSSATETWVTPGKYNWDITISYTSGPVITPLTGIINIIGISTNKAS